VKNKSNCDRGAGRHDKERKPVPGSGRRLFNCVTASYALRNNLYIFSIQILFRRRKKIEVQLGQRLSASQGKRGFGSLGARRSITFGSAGFQR